MKQITKYIADDGNEFTNHVDCEIHETDCKLAALIMKPLPNKPDSCDFSNGNGHIQHDKELLLKTRNKFLKFCLKFSDHKFIQQTIDMGFDAHTSWAGRVLGECLPSSIYKHWHRFQCIDSDFREWGQPYLADHPNEGKNIQLNRQPNTAKSDEG